MKTIEAFKTAWNRHKGADNRKVTIKPHFIRDKGSKIFRADYYTYYVYDGDVTVSFYLHHKLKNYSRVDGIERVDCDES